MVTTPNDSGITDLPPSLLDHHEVLNRLEEYAEKVLLTESHPLRRTLLLRFRADEDGYPITEKTAQILLAKASGRDAGLVKPIMRGDKIDSTPTPWVWEGVLMAGTFNLLVAPPKVGKSALMVGLLGAWYHGQSDYLGQAIHGPCPKVYIVGTDQPQSDWLMLFRREGLTDSDGNLGGPIEMLWHTGAPLHLTDEGITHLAEIASENPGSMFLVDSYHACCAPLGLDEATSAFDGPARQLSEALSPYASTLVMIHHTNKSVSGGNATNASRGSNALPAAASLTILMNWFRQPAEGQTQSDHRVVVKTQGRAKGSTILVELKDDGWIHHGDGDSVLAAEAMQEAADELQGRQADVFDYIKERWSVGRFPVAGTEIASQFNLERNKASRCLRALVRKGLIAENGSTGSGDSGGRPSPLYRPKDPSPSEACQTSQTCQTSRTYENKGFGTFDTFATFAQGRGGSAPEEGLAHPLNGSPVELHRGNAWSNGWVLKSSENLNACIAEKLGNPQVRINNLRWGVDVRLCESSAFKGEALPAEATIPDQTPEFDF